MKLTFFLLLILLFPVRNSAQFHTIDIMGDDKKVTLDFEYVQGFIVVKVYLSRVLPLYFIFDTGAENTILLNQEYARIMGLKMDDKVEIIGSDRKTITIGHISRRVDLQFEEGNPFVIDMIVLDKSKIDFENIIGREIDGIIGGNMLYGAILDIDYRRGKLKFHHPEGWTASNKYIKKDIEVIRQRPYLPASIAANEESDTINVNLLLDTGAAIHLLIDEYSHPDLAMPDSIIDGRIADGLGGILGGFLGNIHNIKLLDQYYSNIPVYYQKADTFLYKAHEVENLRNGIVGNLFLQRHKIIIDYPRENLYYKPIKARQKPFRYNKSGMTVFAVGPYLDQFIVKHVARGSPSGRAGLQPGDVIKNINGFSSIVINLSFINRLLSRSEGKKIKLKVLRAGELVKVEFVLSIRKIPTELIRED